MTRNDGGWANDSEMKATGRMTRNDFGEYAGAVRRTLGRAGRLRVAQCDQLGSRRLRALALEGGRGRAGARVGVSANARSSDLRLGVCYRNEANNKTIAVAELASVCIPVIRHCYSP